MCQPSSLSSIFQMVRREWAACSIITDLHSRFVQQFTIFLQSFWVVADDHLISVLNILALNHRASAALGARPMDSDISKVFIRVHIVSVDSLMEPKSQTTIWFQPKLIANLVFARHLIGFLQGGWLDLVEWQLELLIFALIVHLCRWVWGHYASSSVWTSALWAPCSLEITLAVKDAYLSVKHSIVFCLLPELLPSVSYLGLQGKFILMTALLTHRGCLVVAWMLIELSRVSLCLIIID